MIDGINSDYDSEFSKWEVASNQEPLMLESHIFRPTLTTYPMRENIEITQNLADEKTLLLAKRRVETRAEVRLEGSWGPKNKFDWDLSGKAGINDHKGNFGNLKVTQGLDGTGSAKVSVGHDSSYRQKPTRDIKKEK